MNKRNIIIIAATCLILASINSYAFYFGGEKALGLAGAYTAVADDTSAIFMNPAGIAQTGGFITELDYLTDSVQDSKLWGISVIDSKTSHLAAGLSYYKMGRDDYPTSSDSEELFVLALAEQYTASLCLGINFKYIKQRHQTIDDMTGDFGALLLLSPELKVSLVGKNLIETKMEEIHRLWTGGAAYKITPSLQFSFDITKDMDTRAENDITYSYGAEILSVKQIRIRGGYMVDKIQDKKFYSFNLGYAAASFYIGYVLMRDEVDASNTTHNISLSISSL